MRGKKISSREELEARLLKGRDPEFREAYERVKIAYAFAQQRVDLGLTQEKLAELAGVQQSLIARLESGKHNPTLNTLRRVARALGCSLKIQLIPQGDLPESPGFVEEERKEQ